MATKVRRETNRGYSITETQAAAVTNTSSEMTLFTQSIPAGSMGANKILDFKVVCQLVTPLVSVPSVTISIKFGTMTLVVVSGLNVAIGVTTGRPFLISGQIANYAANLQYCWAKIDQYATNTPIVNATAAAMIDGDGAVDTSVDQTFSITVALAGLGLSGTFLTPKIVTLDLS